MICRQRCITGGLEDYRKAVAGVTIYAAGIKKRLKGAAVFLFACKKENITGEQVIYVYVINGKFVI